MEILQKGNILVDVGEISKAEALNRIGQLLINSGYVNEGYINEIFEREKIVNTYIGNGVAIPHGVSHSEKYISKSGIAILQSKEGIEYGDNKAYIIIGIAGINDEHLNILSNIAIFIQDEENVRKLIAADTSEEIYNMLITEMN